MKPHTRSLPNRLLGAASALIISGLCAASPPSCWGQVEPPPETPEPGATAAPLTVEIVQARQKEAAASTELDEAAKTKIEELYTRALAELESAGAAASAAATYAAAVKLAPQQLAEAKAEQAPPPAATLVPPADATLEELTQLLRDTEERQEKLQEQFDRLQTEPGRRARRQAEISKELEESRAGLADIAEQLAAAAADAPLALAKAKQTHLLARRQALNRRIEALRGEQAIYAATAELLPLQRDNTAARLAQLEKQLPQLRAVVKQRSDLETEQQLRLARREAAQAHPAVKSVLEENTRLIQERQDLQEQRNTLQQKLQTLGDLRDQWHGRIQRTKNKIEAVGLSETIALLLREQRRQLPQPARHRREARSRRELVRDVQYRRLELYDLRNDLADIDDEVEATLRNVQWPAAEDESQEVRFAAEEAFEERRRLLNELIKDYDSYFETLTELDAVQRQIAGESEQYAVFIDELVLWIRSTEPLREESIQRFRESAARWADPAWWSSLGYVVFSEAQRHAIAYLLAIGGFFVWIYYHQRMRRRIGDIGRRVRSNPAVSVMESVEASILTLTVALLWPGLLLLLAWRLNSAASANDASRAVAHGLSLASGTYLLLEVPRRVCRGNGLAEAHFLWPSRSVAHLRQTVRALLFFLVPAALIIGISESLTSSARDDALSRVVFILTMLVVAVFSWRLLRHRGRFVQDIVARNPEGWWAWLRRILFLPPVAVALLLAALAATGYYHTALELTWRAELSLALLIALILLYGLALRWLVAARIRLARLRMLRHQAEAAAAYRPQTTDEESAAPPPPQPDDAAREIDQATIRDQTRRLLLTLLSVVGLLALWAIWIEVFPALGILRRVPVGGTTLAHIALAVLVGVVAIVASRNLSGLLEVAVLQRLPLDAGARYAITTIGRYTVCIAAVVVISWLVGFDWSKIQWLVAAMLVGLGFGLQEIFANFVSGLIILLERPIRPGDWVTIGTTDGRVMKINMRATTVRDWDRKELIVPNKEIVTGQVMNWSLSESTLRIVIHVGIAYGSDTELATQILYRIAAEHPRVLDKPKPKVIFREFGDSALVFEVRIFIPHLDYWPRVMHEVHMAIDREFRAAGITIAFPQRDLHIKSVDRPIPHSSVAESIPPAAPASASPQAQPPKPDQSPRADDETKAPSK